MKRTINWYYTVYIASDLACTRKIPIVSTVTSRIRAEGTVASSYSSVKCVNPAQHSVGS